MLSVNKTFDVTGVGVVKLGVKVIMLCLLAISIGTHLLTTVANDYWILALQACLHE